MIGGAFSGCSKCKGTLERIPTCRDCKERGRKRKVSLLRWLVRSPHSLVSLPCRGRRHRLRWFRRRSPPLGTSSNLRSDLLESRLDHIHSVVSSVASVVAASSGGGRRARGRWRRRYFGDRRGRHSEAEGNRRETGGRCGRGRNCQGERRSMLTGSLGQEQFICLEQWVRAGRVRRRWRWVS